MRDWERTGGQAGDSELRTGKNIQLSKWGTMLSGRGNTVNTVCTRYLWHFTPERLMWTVVTHSLSVSDPEYET